MDQPTGERPRFCSSCGEALVPEARFCAACGTAVAPEPPPTVEIPQTDPPAPKPAEPAATVPVPRAETPPGSRSSSTSWAPWIVGVGVAGLIALAIVVFASLRGDDATPPPAGERGDVAASPMGGSVTAPSDEPSSPVSSPVSTTGSAIPEGWQTCTNTSKGFSISYPSGWYTTDVATKWNGVTKPKPQLACNFLNPKPFKIYWGTEPPTTAIVVSHESQGLADAVSIHADPAYLSVVGREDLTVAGRPAVRLEVTQSGKGYYPRGTLEYQYLIQVDPSHTLVVSTMYFPGSDTDYPGAKATVDQAAQTVTLP